MKKLTFLSLLILSFVSCKKKKDEALLPITTSPIVIPTITLKPDTGSKNSYFSEKQDAYFYFERFTEFEENYYNVLHVNRKDRVFAFSMVNSVKVDNLIVEFDGFKIPFDSNYSAYPINFSTSNSYSKKYFSLPNLWHITEKNGLLPLDQAILSIPDTFSFVNPQTDSSLAGQAYVIELDKPITNADSILIELKGFRVNLSKVIPSGAKKFLLTAEETARFKDSDWNYCDLSILSYRRQRIKHNGKKYVFETARLVQKYVFIK